MPKEKYVLVKIRESVDMAVNMRLATMPDAPDKQDFLSRLIETELKRRRIPLLISGKGLKP